MPPDVSTVNDDPPILSDREFLEDLAAKVDGLAGTVWQLYGFVQGERDTTRKQLDHLDVMLHEVHQFIEEHRPALARALAFLSPGTGLRDYFGKGARRERNDHRDH